MKPKLVQHERINAIPKRLFFLYLLLVLFSLSPIFNEFGRMLSVSAIGVLMWITAYQYRSTTTIMFGLFLISLLPLTLWDMSISLSSGFVTYSFLLIMVYLFIGYLAASSTKDFKFLHLYESVFLPLSIASFVFYAIFIIQPSLAYTLPEYEYQETTHRTAVFLNVLMNPEPVLRNCGFTSEPGFYQIFLNMALFARIDRLGKPDKYCMFYLLVVISTLSTTGLAVSIFLVISKFDGRYKFIVAIILAIFWTAAIELIEVQYTTKIENESVFGPRFEPSLNALNLMMLQPLGIGSVEYTNTYQQLNIGSYDSYTQVGLRYGITGVIGLLLLMANLARQRFALAFLFGISFMTSPIWFNPVITACFFMTPLSVGEGRKNNRSRSAVEEL
jgi:hypothetical protein